MIFAEYDVKFMDENYWENSKEFLKDVKCLIFFSIIWWENKCHVTFYSSCYAIFRPMNFLWIYWGIGEWKSIRTSTGIYGTVSFSICQNYPKSKFILEDMDSCTPQLFKSQWTFITDVTLLADSFYFKASLQMFSHLKNSE